MQLSVVLCRRICMIMLRMIKRIVLLAGLFSMFFVSQTKAQQASLYSQYYMNQFLLNPAVAGAEGYTNVNLCAREQWLGLPGAPSTYNVCFQSRFLKNSFISRNSSVRKKKRYGSRSAPVGYGGNLYTDQNGPISTIGFQGTYAYHIRMKGSQLSFGLSLKAYQYRINRGDLKGGEKQEDDLLDNSKLKTYIPDGNLGVYLKARDYYGGFAVDNLFNAGIQFGDKGNEFGKLKRTYTMFGGYIYQYDKKITIEPSLLMRSSEQLRFQAELGGRVNYLNDYWGGLAYRSGGGGSGSSKGWIIIHFGMRFEKFYFGYAFDYVMASIQKYTFGSHEIMAAVKFGDNARRYKWLNRY